MVATGQPAQAILDAAQELAVDLIVLGPEPPLRIPGQHGHGLLCRHPRHLPRPHPPQLGCTPARG